MEKSDTFDDYYRAAIPAKEALDKDIEYYIEAADIFENMASEGTEDYPFLAMVVIKKGGTWYKKWWVWAIAAGAVGGACVAADCISGPEPGSPTTMATVTIE